MLRYPGREKLGGVKKMDLKQISIEGNTLRVELGETDALILSRAWLVTKPFMGFFLVAALNTILLLASLDKDSIRLLFERLRRVDPPEEVFIEAGIDIQALGRDFDKVPWPTDEELVEFFSNR
jgi:hypothetical protein